MKRGRKATVRPKRADKHEPTLGQEIRRLQKTQALLIAVQYAASYDVEFSVSDALAVVVALNEESLTGLDRVEVTHGRE